MASYFDTGLTDWTFDTGVSLATSFSFYSWLAIVSFSSLQSSSSDEKTFVRIKVTEVKVL